VIILDFGEVVRRVLAGSRQQNTTAGSERWVKRWIRRDPARGPFGSRTVRAISSNSTLSLGRLKFEPQYRVWGWGVVVQIWAVVL